MGLSEEPKRTVVSESEGEVAMPTEKVKCRGCSLTLQIVPVVKANAESAGAYTNAFILRA